jgi:hypothetical protein
MINTFARNVNQFLSVELFSIKSEFKTIFCKIIRLIFIYSSMTAAPKSVVIRQEDANESLSDNGSIRSIDEGADLRLSCLVLGADPAPTIRWIDPITQDDLQLEHSLQLGRSHWSSDRLRFDNPTTRSILADGSIQHRSSIVIANLTRHDLSRRLMCTASNSNLTTAMSHQITIDMNRTFILRLTTFD